MKKIPTAFERIYENHKVVGIKDKFTSKDTERAVTAGVATLKWDGSCCAIINGELYKRYDAKKGKKPPKGAIPCCEADPITGHHPHWMKCDRDNPSDKWFIRAWENAKENDMKDGTYEAIGKHFQGNPYDMDDDTLVEHGGVVINGVTRTFEGIKEYLSSHYIEGIVFWLNGEPATKIKRSDFGFPWK